jgi:hypothetical protein
MFASIIYWREKVEETAFESALRLKQSAEIEAISRDLIARSQERIAASRDLLARISDRMKYQFE